MDISRWTEQETIKESIDSLRQVITQILESGFARVKIPKGWDTWNYDGKTFWDKLSEIFEGDKSKMIFVSTYLFDRVFRGCEFQTKSFGDALNDLTNLNPNIADEEYYSALRMANLWPPIPEELHDANLDDCYHRAVRILEDFPVSEISFAQRSKSVFGSLTFHENFETTLSGHGKTSKYSNYSQARITGIAGFSNAVTKCLKTLNDYVFTQRDTRLILRDLAAKAGFECTAEGGNNQHLKFNNINCEYHFKICQSNDENETDYKDRLYFGFLNTNGQRSFLIAHSGIHL